VLIYDQAICWRYKTTRAPSIILLYIYINRPLNTPSTVDLKAHARHSL